MNETVTRRSLKEAVKGRTDWKRVDTLTDAEIDKASAADPDAAPQWRTLPFFRGLQRLDVVV